MEADTSITRTSHRPTVGEAAGAAAGRSDGRVDVERMEVGA